jgi:hypothetical protein
MSLPLKMLVWCVWSEVFLRVKANDVIIVPIYVLVLDV